MKYRIGVDVGGTNTDAAVIDTTAATHTSSRGVITSGKTPTTPDVTTGIYTIIEQVLADAKIDRRDVLSVAIGTTHFVNAVVQADRRRLSRVAVIRLCGPFTRQVPPWVDFPPTLRSIIEGPVFYLDGGLEIDGREISSLKPAQIKDTVRAIQAAGVDRVAVTGVFSPLDHRGMHEETCKKLMLDFDPTLSVVCSHSIGGIGLLERENATILNASILTLARRTVNAFCQAMAKLQLHCPLYLTQNDGTLTDAATAAELPIRTFASGPTNSMTGAAYLAGLDQGTGPSHADTQILVVDVGGTTSDICGLLPSGFPRQAANVVEVGGVRTAFSMPEVLSIGLGGGSRVALSENSDAVSVGPDSVGHKLTGQALVFGGKVITATDIVVASGAAEIGDPRKVQHLPSSLVSAVRAQIKKLLERAIENMKVSDLPVTLLLVGGGSVMQMDPLEGVAACMIPPHRDSANAVGAAIAKVAGEIDIIEILAGRDEKMVLEGAKRMAMEVAVARGADETDVKIVEVDQIPLQYVTNKATRLVIKAVGKLAPLDIAAIPAKATNSWEELELENQVEDDRELEGPTKNIPSVQHAADIDIDAYRPNIQHGIWYVSPVDLEFITTGTGVLGTGGGGPPRLQYLHSLEYFRNPQYQGKMRIIAPECLADSDVCVLGLWYGAPSVSIERIPAGDELMTAIDFSSKLSGHSHFDAIVAGEIGGGNGLSAFPTSSYYDVPVVDGDLMGRAYPTLAHCTPYVYDHPVVPCVMADGKGNTGAVMQAESHRRVETMLRSQCIDLGLKVAVSSTPLAGDVIKQYAIPNTVSQAWYIGRAIHQARKAKRNIINSIFETTPGKLLYTGKVIHVQRDVSRGYTMGQCTIAPLRDDEKEPSRPYSEETRHLVVPFQNEFLYAGYSSPDNPDRELDVICTVPDLISILGADGEAIGSPELRYGLNVSVIAMAAHPLWTGKQGLRVGGPEGFGMEMAWKSLGEYQKPRSVVEEFDRIPE